MKDKPVTLWDPLVRLFHASFAATFLVNYFATEAGGSIHQWLGYSAIGLLMIRMVWGFIGPRPARWRHFWPTRERLKFHFQQLRQGKPHRHLGHSPLGALVMITMMLIMVGLGVTGYMMEETDIFWGVKWVEQLHGLLANSLMMLVIIHISAAIYESVKLKDNLPASMITGKRRKQ